MQLFSPTDVIVVTGAAGGLGAAMCRRFAELGAKVALSDLDSSDGGKDADEIGDGVSFFPMDVTDESAVGRAADAIAAELGPVTGVVANAGIAPTSPSLEYPERHVAYGASKAAVSHMAALLGVEWAPLGIRVNAVAPGYVETPILDKMKEENPETVREWEAAMPIGRLLKPAEVADATAFLLSDLARAVTGATLACDGGYSKA